MKLEISIDLYKMSFSWWRWKWNSLERLLCVCVRGEYKSTLHKMRNLSVLPFSFLEMWRSHLSAYFFITIYRIELKVTLQFESKKRLCVCVPIHNRYIDSQHSSSFISCIRSECIRHRWIIISIKPHISNKFSKNLIIPLVFQYVPLNCAAITVKYLVFELKFDYSVNMCGQYTRANEKSILLSSYMTHLIPHKNHRNICVCIENVWASVCVRTCACMCVRKINIL